MGALAPSPPIDADQSSFYNKTTFSGLETHISNSYTNALLQALHYVQPIRKVLISHIFSSDCLAEHCLGCQVGFLLKMLEDAKGRNCQASNFLKVFGENGASECSPRLGRR